MKKLLAVLCVLAVLCAGCSGVLMNAQYATLLDKTVAFSSEVSARASAGTLTPDEMKQALAQEAALWRAFQAARDGKASAP